MQAFSPKTLLKRGSNPGVFLWILRNFQEHLFWIERFATRADNITSNTGSEEDAFSNTKQKSHSKCQLDEKNLSFHDALDHLVFIYFSSACLRQFLSYILKTIVVKDFKTVQPMRTNPGPMEKLS